MKIQFLYGYVVLSGTYHTYSNTRIFSQNVIWKMESCLTNLSMLRRFCIYILLKIGNCGWRESCFTGVNSVANIVAEALTKWLTKSLTNSMELPVKLTHPQLVNKFPAFYGTREFHYQIHNRPSHTPILSQINSYHASPSHFFKIYFSIILLPTPGLAKRSPSLNSLHQIPVCTSPFPHMFYMSCPSHSSWFNHLNNIWWGVHIIKLLIM